MYKGEQECEQVWHAEWETLKGVCVHAEERLTLNDTKYMP